MSFLCGAGVVLLGRHVYVENRDVLPNFLGKQY